MTVSTLLENIPDEALLVDTHEYVLVDDNRARVGISHYAVECLGDVVYVELPVVGDTLDKGDTFGSVESVKAASDLYMPLSGEIVAVNSRLGDEPELLNEDCYGDGWIIEIELSNTEETEELLSPQQYAEMVDSASDD